MPTLLIIEDQYSSSTSLTAACRSLAGDYEILPAKSKSEAVDLLTDTPLTLVLCDMSSGYGLVVDTFADLTFQFPHIPFIPIVDTQQKLEKKVMDLGAAACLAAPFSPAELKTTVDNVARRAVQGTVHGIPLYSLLQMMENDETSCTLKVSSGRHSATIYLEDGAPAAAETADGRLNEEALYTAMVWPDPTIVIQYYSGRRRREIETPMMAIIIEAFKRQDEGGREEQPRQNADSSEKRLQEFAPRRNMVSFEAGARIKLETDPAAPQILCTIAGAIPDRFLILIPPKAAELLKDFSHNQVEIGLRYMHLSKLYLFRSRIVTEIFSPAHLLFLEYPKTMQSLEMRRAKRTSTFVPAALKCAAGDDMKGVITDISKIGCQFSSRENIAACRPDLDINSDIELLASVPGLDGKQLLRGKIKNIQKSNKDLQFGIHFESLSNKIHDALEKYVLASAERLEDNR